MASRLDALTAILVTPAMTADVDPRWRRQAAISPSDLRIVCTQGEYRCASAAAVRHPVNAYCSFRDSMIETASHDSADVETKGRVASPSALSGLIHDVGKRRGSRGASGGRACGLEERGHFAKDRARFARDDDAHAVLDDFHRALDEEKEPPVGGALFGR